MFENISAISENEVVVVDKSNLSEDIFASMDYDIDSIMRVIDNKTE